MRLGLLNVARNDNGDNLNEQATKNVRYKSIVSNLENRIGNNSLESKVQDEVNDGLGKIIATGNVGNESILDKIKNKKIEIKQDKGLGGMYGGWWQR